HNPLKTQLFPHPFRGASCVGLLRPQMSEGEFGDGKSQPDREPGWHRHRTGAQAQPGNCTTPAAQAAPISTHASLNTSQRQAAKQTAALTNTRWHKARTMPG